MADITKLPRRVLEERFVELEDMLNEFQESSKELEKALEEELQAEEVTNKNLLQSLDAKDTQINKLKEDNVKLTREINDVHDKYATRMKEYEDQLTNLRQSLVSVEISNDYMESNDRVLSNKLELATQFNNELLERIALVENDLELERRLNMQKALHITNYQNQISSLELERNQLTRKLQSLAPQEEEEYAEANGTVVGIEEILQKGPPKGTRSFLNAQLPRAESFQRIKDLNISIDLRFSNFQATLPYSDSTSTLKSTLKSTATTQSTAHVHTTNSRRSSRERERDSDTLSIHSRISPSPSMLNLSEKLGDKSKRHSTLHTIKGSPSSSKIKDIPPDKKKSLLGPLSLV